ncbi:hypothetical protein [Oenococcus sp.]|uniref:hypothetical protein n=1 Tax=Oenococcus sp. TaxID=1979414 RepID=UPI0039EC5906
MKTTKYVFISASILFSILSFSFVSLSQNESAGLAFAFIALVCMLAGAWLRPRSKDFDNNYALIISLVLALCSGVISIILMLQK